MCLNVKGEDLQDVRVIKGYSEPGAIMGVPIDEYKMVYRLDNHPIVIVPLWESTPASDGDKRTFDS